MRNIGKNLRAKSLLRIAALAVATTSLGGCATLYDDYYGNSYYDNAYSDYSCDPYSPFDNYYDCDSRLGFYNFGYSGGWYNNLFYPGHGFYIFDRGGRRYDMDNHYRRYWGGRRHEYWQQNGRHHGQRGGHHNFGGSGRPGNYQPIAWPEQNGGRVNDGEHRQRDRRHDGRHQGGHQGNGQGYSNGGQHSDHNGGGRGYGRRDGRGDGQGGGQGGGQPAPVSQNAGQQNEQAPTLRHPRNGNVNSGRPEGDYGNRGRGRDFSANTVQQQSAPAPQARPEPRAQQSRPEPRSEPRAAPSHPRAAPARERSSSRFGNGSNDRMD